MAGVVRAWSWLRSWLAVPPGFGGGSPAAAPAPTAAPVPPVPPVQAHAMPTRAELEVMAEAAARQHSVPPNTLKGLVTVESAWKPRAIRQEPAVGDASRGLTQILLRTAIGEGFTGTAEELFDPVTNLNLGASYLARQYRRFGSWDAALAAYNGGPAAGIPVTRITTSVLARDQVTGAPVRTFTAQPGQFRNQPYVDSVNAATRGYGLTSAGLGGTVGLLLVVGLLSGLVKYWKAG